MLTTIETIERGHESMGDESLEKSTQKNRLKNRKGEYDEKWLKESTAKHFEKRDDEERANFSREHWRKIKQNHQQSKKELLKFTIKLAEVNFIVMYPGKNYWKKLLTNLLFQYLI